MKQNRIGIAGRNNVKATAAGLMRELIAWPLLAIGAFGYTIAFGPNHYVILAAFFLSVLIIITTRGSQRMAACYVIVAFSVMNAWYIHYPPEQMFTEGQFWFVNRLLYAVGLGFYVQPILDKVFKDEKGQMRALIVGPLLLLAAFLLYWVGRPDFAPRLVNCAQILVETSQCIEVAKNTAWYTPDQLYDDVLVGMAAGLIYGALSSRKLASRK
jgi:hypothetical protein